MNLIAVSFLLFGYTWKVSIFRPRDVILSVNDFSMRNVTRADYMTYLGYLTDDATFVSQKLELYQKLDNYH